MNYNISTITFSTLYRNLKHKLPITIHSMIFANTYCRFINFYYKWIRSSREFYFYFIVLCNLFFIKLKIVIKCTTDSRLLCKKVMINYKLNFSIR